jgi:ribosomal protein L16 Arg81 hydroxylase
MSLSFERLLYPVPPAQFFADVYEKKPLVIPAQDRTRFDQLLSVAAIDRFLATTSPCHPDVFLVDASRDLPPEEYSFQNGMPAGRIDLPRVYQHFAAGATISISHLQECLPELAALCRATEKVFSHHFQTNIYLSPPNAQGFKTHFDSHDVFVLQIAGSKIWTLNDTGIELPLHGQRFEPGVHTAGPVTQEFTLRPGDLLYCPRGLYHAARSNDEVSLHITLGLIGKTWADVVTESLSEAVLATPAFRANLPVGYADEGFDRTAARAIFRTLVETFANEAKVDGILDRMAEDFVKSRRPDHSGGLQEFDGAPEITFDTRVVPKPDLLYLLREESEQLTILFGPSQITMPAFTADSVRFALRGAPFAVRDLPEPLDDAGTVVLVKRLIREGLLKRTDEASASVLPQATKPALVA